MNINFYLIQVAFFMTKPLYHIRKFRWRVLIVGFYTWLGDDDDDDEDDYLERFFDDILGEDDDDDEEEDLSPSTGLVQQQQPAQPVQQTAQVASTNAVEETPVGGTDYPGMINCD